MKILDTGKEEVKHPHRCQDALWNLEKQYDRMNIGTVVACDCDAIWRIQTEIGFWRDTFGSLKNFHSTYSGRGYWVRIKKGI